MLTRNQTPNRPFLTPNPILNLPFQILNLIPNLCQTLNRTPNLLFPTLILLFRVQMMKEVQDPLLDPLQDPALVHLQALAQSPVPHQHQM